jgi:hypothetical protein
MRIHKLWKAFPAIAASLGGVAVKLVLPAAKRERGRDVPMGMAYMQPNSTSGPGA